MDTTQSQSLFPNFSHIQPESIEPALKKLLTENRKKLQTLLKEKNLSFQNLIMPLEEMDDRLSQFWAPISHLHSVMESEELRAAYNACLPILTEYHTEFMQNETLYNALKKIAESPEYQTLNMAEKKLLDNSLRDFRLTGVHLPSADKASLGELQKKLNKLSTKFSENLLDATHAWDLHITDPTMLMGLPPQIIKIAEQNAKQHNKEGYVFTLDHSTYAVVMKNLNHREFRWLMYQAYVTRASDQGPNAGRFDNTPIMNDILKERNAFAKILDFKNYAEYSLKTKMAESPDLVMTFLQDLVERSKQASENEMAELQAFAKEMDGISPLEAWDFAYYSEKLREAKFSYSEEDIRPYFPINKVLSGMFTVVNKLYGLTIKERNDVDIWHPHVQFFEVYDKDQQLRGYFYIDLYARPHKREGAWMDECRGRRKLADGSIQLPIAFLTCNFSRPLDDKPALLMFDDVVTLFHEFGHCLHHIVTQVDRAAVAGINGVPWDAVEFPSQFFEFWCYEKEVLDLISSHFETGLPLPDAMYQKLHAAKNFHAGVQMLRQLEFALFDFRIHLEYDPTLKNFIQHTLNDVREHVAVIKTPVFNRFQHSFSHVFAGGYAAGYYSYKWAEVLSADAFSKFEEKGIFDQKTGQEFLHILESGGTKSPMDLYVEFRGRKPTVDALLK
ncbi:MAG TPA: M3 family metallopeptidase, partial [Gammaproteobacteria bacterium]|nr:M3 family metallopeptidase [Gammaproteobacteria bacterium]